MSSPDQTPLPQMYNAHELERTFGLGFSRFVRHYSGNRYCFLFLRVLRCFNSPGYPPDPILFKSGYPEINQDWFSNSGISGSKFANNSPKLIAVNHAFHRLLTPRYSPYALSRLTIKSITQLLSFTQTIFSFQRTLRVFCSL